MVLLLRLLEDFMDERKTSKIYYKNMYLVPARRSEGVWVRTRAKSSSSTTANSNNAIKNSPRYDFSPKNLLDNSFRRLNISLRVCSAYGSSSFTGTRHLSMVNTQFVNCWFACSSADLTKHIYAQFVKWQQCALHWNHFSSPDICVCSLAPISVHSIFPFCSLIHVFIFMFMCGVAVSVCFHCYYFP